MRVRVPLRAYSDFDHTRWTPHERPSLPCWGHPLQSLEDTVHFEHGSKSATVLRQFRNGYYAARSIRESTKLAPYVQDRFYTPESPKRYIDDPFSDNRRNVIDTAKRRL